MKVQETCRVCGSARLSIACDRIRGDIACDVLRCEDCGLTFLPSDYFDPKALAELYRDNYAYVPTLGAMVDSERDPYRFKADKIAQYLDPSHTALLEVGTGAGLFLRAVKGRVKRLEGVELANGQREYCETTYQVPVHGKPIEEIDFTAPFDVVCSFQVLEHVPDPVPFLKRLMHFVKPGGILYVDVPNGDNALTALYKIEEYKRFFYRRQHLFNHTRKSLELLLRRAGFENFNIWTDQYYSLSNHLLWGASRKPQATLADAYSFLPPGPLGGASPVETEMAAFFERTDREYRAILERNDFGDTISAIIAKPQSSS
ncbi:MAG: class I SAM-dependent methyltransferase [Rhodospirillales bacterium]|nr:class I SAM-dependent methyltransferase [Rhodospirillales bacterium]